MAITLSLFLFSCASNTVKSNGYEDSSQITTNEYNSVNDDIEPSSQDFFMEYIPGVWNNNEFTSAWYGFTFVALPNMKTISEKDLKLMNAQMSRAFDGPGAESYAYEDMKIVYEVVSSTEDGLTSINILTEKSFKDGLTVEEYAEILMQELKTTHGRNIDFEELVFTKIGKYNYYTLTAEINIDGIVSYKSFFLLNKINRFATVLFDYTIREQFLELLYCFS